MHETKTINVCLCVCCCVSKRAKKAVADHYSSAEGQVKKMEKGEKRELVYLVIFPYFLNCFSKPLI